MDGPSSSSAAPPRRSSIQKRAVEETPSFDDKDKLDAIANILASSRNIIVLAGAGISSSAGIPDFRSPNGLYNTLNYQELGLTSPEDLFDIETFIDDPRPFYKFAHSLYPGTIRPTPTHRFLANLYERRTLLRIYTQNIDALEELAGVGSEGVVYAHGSLIGARCMKCGTAYSANDIASDVLSGTVPLCIRPRRKKAKVAVVIAGGEMEGRTVLRHSARLISTSTYATTSKSDDDNGRRGVLVTGGGSCGGIIKPNVTFFGEKLDDGVGRRLEKDSLRADALLVMGTSLSVAPMSKVVNYLKPDIPRILINRNIVRVPKISSTDDGYPFHACLLGDCDVVVEALARRMEGMYAGKKSSTTGIERDGATTNGSTSIDETRLHDQPKECILLFDGADVSNSSDEAQVQQKLVVHCDECHDAIEGRVYCCKTCFDYDLCGACYPFSSLAHANGKHDFAVER